MVFLVKKVDPKTIWNISPENTAWDKPLYLVCMLIVHSSWLLVEIFFIKFPPSTVNGNMTSPFDTSLIWNSIRNFLIPPKVTNFKSPYPHSLPYGCSLSRYKFSCDPNFNCLYPLFDCKTLSVLTLSTRLFHLPFKPPCELLSRRPDFV